MVEVVLQQGAAHLARMGPLQGPLLLGWELTFAQRHIPVQWTLLLVTIRPPLVLSLIHISEPTRPY